MTLEIEMAKLNYRIVGRKSVIVPALSSVYGSSLEQSLDVVAIEWTHEDGPVPEYALLPHGHPPDITYVKTKVGERAVIHDEVRVKSGMPDSIVMQLCEEKRAVLAANLEVEP